MKQLLLLGILISIFSCQQKTVPKSGLAESSKIEIYKINYQEQDKVYAKQIEAWLNTGQQQIEDFFNHPFKNPFTVNLFTNRDSLDKQWQKDWNMPTFKSQCWMVASGIGHRLDILSPGKWKEQACEHNPEDTTALRKLIVHELVHVYHGQQNPSPTFENVENIDWFVEGVAVYVSGQNDKERYQRTKKFLQEEQGPTKLSNIWKGEHRYGMAGTIVQYIDETYGRDMLFTSLSKTKATEVLGLLHTTEEELIRNWKKYIK